MFVYSPDRGSASDDGAGPAARCDLPEGKDKAGSGGSSASAPQSRPRKWQQHLARRIAAQPLALPFRKLVTQPIGAGSPTPVF
ncbi:hypothetical protein [Agrobacterium tumefaciens]|uniref:hypothetical protein n=1 Tax=Agrobacterium tumefaciens TaxID=358 RepID=UPI0021FB67F7|nr:hypothetical protein FY143_22950 [Agrobacterium tumefaciens]UXT84276.1 hypothetical protein FY131_22830 [Agrobacterium tumefaciens]